MQAVYLTSRSYNQPQGIAGFTYSAPITLDAAAGGGSGNGDVTKGAMRMRLGLALLVATVKGGK